MPERTSYERETLLFSQPEAAQEFSEHVRQRLGQQQGPVRRGREIVAEEVAKEFAKEGEAIGTIRHPWEHSQEEHAEAQHLVDLTFAHDLSAALKEAQQSNHYPRNLDLFHDVLTGEMYTLLQEHGLTKQPVAVPLLILTAIVVGVVLLLIFLWIIS